MPPENAACASFWPVDPRALERETGAAIETSRTRETRIVNQIGQDTLPELLALLQRATVLLAPDSGPVHMATMVQTPVIGLYAATNPAAQRSVPVTTVVRGCVW